MHKAELLDAESEEIKSKITRLDSTISERVAKIADLDAKIKECIKENDFENAIKYCEELVSIDVKNRTKWEKKVKSIETEQKAYNERVAVLAECRENVLKASFEDKWDDVQKNCRRALSYDITDDFFQRYLEKAVKELGKRTIDKTVKTIGAGVEKVKDTVVGIIGKERKVEAKVDESDGWDFGSSKPSSGPSKQKGSGTTSKKDGADGWDFGSSKLSSSPSKPKESGTTPKKDGADGWDFGSSKPKGASTSPKKGDFDF